MKHTVGNTKYSFGSVVCLLHCCGGIFTHLSLQHLLQFIVVFEPSPMHSSLDPATAFYLA